jgi:hypothetical protein
MDKVIVELEHVFLLLARVDNWCSNPKVKKLKSMAHTCRKFVIKSALRFRGIRFAPKKSTKFRLLKILIGVTRIRLYEIS